MTTTKKKTMAGVRGRLSLRALGALVLALAMTVTTLLLLLRGPPFPSPDLAPFRSPSSHRPHPHMPPRGGSARVPLFGTVNAAQLFALFGSITLGTPPQRFNVAFETGEHVVWLPSARGSTHSSPHAVYNHAASRSYVADGADAAGFGAYYAFHGFVSRDTVRVGDLALPNVSFVEVTRVESPPDFATVVAVDGMFGLSPDLARNAVLQCLMRSAELDAPVFAFYFDRKHQEVAIENDALAAASVGELLIGAVDRRRYTGELRFVPTIDTKSWRVTLDAVTVANQSDNFATTEMTAPAMLDGRVVVPADVAPSWPAILGPAEDIRRLAKAVGAEGDRIDCSSQGPDIVLHIGGVPYTLSKDDYTLRDGSDTESCRWAFVGLDLGYWWLGQPFLRKFYAVFEFGRGSSNSSNPRVGFALAA